MNRNKATEWVDKELLRPYNELTREQQENDRVIVKTACSVFVAHVYGEDAAAAVGEE